MTLAAFCLVLCGLMAYLGNSPAVQAQGQHKIEGWLIKRAWGAMRGSYIDPRTAELRLIFEDHEGTVRIVTINPEAKTAVPVAEMRRE